MPFRVRCPRCGQTAEVPDEALGRSGKCNSCGAMVALPSRLTKICTGCGVDVTRIKHTKDLENNYLCMNCWDARAVVTPSFEELMGITPAPGPSCLDEDVPAPSRPSSIEPAPLPPATDAPPAVVTIMKTRGGGAALIIALLALGAGGVSLAMQLTSKGPPRKPDHKAETPVDWEQANHARLLVLKGQADVLAQVGRLQEAIGCYEKLLSAVEGQTVRGRVLSEEIIAARSALAQAQRAHDAEQRRLAELVIRPAASTPTATHALPIPPTDIFTNPDPQPDPAQEGSRQPPLAPPLLITIPTVAEPPTTRRASGSILDP